MYKQNSLKDRRLRDDMFAQGMLWCSGCGIFHPVKDFAKYLRADRSNYGYRYYCFRCEKRQRDSQKERASQRMKERNSGLKKYWVELAGGCCQRCGFNEFISALDFHHVYPVTKKHTPTSLILNNNPKKTWVELDKCCLLCRNCHGSYQSVSWRAEFIKREGLGWTVGDPLPLDDKRYETAKPPKLQQAPLPLFTSRPKGVGQLSLFDGIPIYVG